MRADRSAPPPMDAARLEEMAARGETVANQDQLSTELRNRQPDNPARRGFDIAPAIFGDPALGAQGTRPGAPPRRG